jgi:D-alanyl-D-alanine carboxypeptidase
MKKQLAIIATCIIIFVALTGVSANCQDIDAQSGFYININGVETEHTSIIRNNTHYVPVRKVFEMVEARVFYRAGDSTILILTRDGDTITHIIGEKIITVNGTERIFENLSIKIDNETYISVNMLSAALCPERVFYDNQHLYIEKSMNNNEHHKVIKDVLDLAENSNFYPERFERYKNYHGKYPDYSVQDVIFRVNLGLDYPFYENISTVEHPYELLVLVNKYNQLPAGFEQYNLVNMDKKYTLNDGKQYLLAGVAYEKYLEMWNAAKKEGLTMLVVSAYRTENYQRNLYNNKVRTSGKVYADNYSARAGHSEHQTGLAIDIGSTRTSFEYTDEFKWLQNHAHEYGFILRYPKGKEWITGYAYEPWHYRYVGVDAAKVIYEEGATYEEYYAKYISINEFR